MNATRDVVLAGINSAEGMPERMISACTAHTYTRPESRALHLMTLVWPLNIPISLSQRLGLGLRPIWARVCADAVLAISGVVGVLVPRVQARPQRLYRLDISGFSSSMRPM